MLEAEDGQAGIELALKHRPEVILCDLLMPKSNGFQVCRAIRQQLQPTKIIMISGRDYEADRASALEAGADEYLLKPITWDAAPKRDRTRSARGSGNRSRRGNESRELPFFSDPDKILGRARVNSRRPGRRRSAMAETQVALKFVQTARSSFSMPAPVFDLSGWRWRRSSVSSQSD